MAKEMIYLAYLLLIGGDIFCFANQMPQNNPTSCNWPYVTRCLNNPILEFNKSIFPALQNINLNVKHENLQINRVFPPIFINNKKSVYTPEKEQVPFVNIEKQLPEAISDYQTNNERIASNGDEQNTLDDFNLSNKESDDRINLGTATFYTGYDNFITTTEGTDVTTENEDEFYRFSPEILSSLLG